ncbi:MAG: TIGR03032 family protein [Candidatus Sumerlaeia bacterium]|nr:TIGR03032 family protein [Candidatus Sumerlaeia bacterium]
MTPQPPAPPQPMLPGGAATGQFVSAPYGVAATPGFDRWLADLGAVLVVTTYESGRIIFFGCQEDGQLVNTARTFERAMGLCLDRNELHLSTLYQVWHFRNLLAPGNRFGDYDIFYAPRTCHVTGLLDIHDMAFEGDGRVVFANTFYSCVATFADGFSFRPLWKPPWISALAPEDRCHLNGLCVRDGKARYVTAVGRTDSREGWRAGRNGGGVLWDIVEDRPVAQGLCMPHSPRWHDGRLFFINAGTGFLCEANPAGGAVREVCFCPGFARGLAIHEGFALVGISSQRQNRTFSDVPLDANLKAHGATESRCALLVIDLAAGRIVHELTFSGSVNELYDVAVLPGARRANALGFMKDDIFYAINIAS